MSAGLVQILPQATPLEFGLEGLKTQNRGYYIYLTEACNIRCSYCFVNEKHNNRHLWDPVTFDRDSGKEDMVGKIINFIVNDPEGRATKYIHFFGGEPLIRAKSIERICSEITEKLKVVAPNCKITWGITTNGTLLTEENCLMMKKWNIGVQLSLDGSEEGNDVHRQIMGGDQRKLEVGHNFSDIETDGRKYGAFKMVKIENYLKHFGTNCRMTLTVHNRKFLVKSFNELTALGFKSFSVIPDSDFGSWDGHFEDLRDTFDEMFEWALANPGYTVNVVDQAMKKIMKPAHKPEHLCQAGRNVIGISVDGDLYPCHDFLGKYSKDPAAAAKLQIGHVDKGWTLNTSMFEDVKCDSTVKSGAGYDCNTCHAQSICERGCPYINYASQGAVKEVNSTYCRITRITADVALHHMLKRGQLTEGAQVANLDVRTKVVMALFDARAEFGRNNAGVALIPGAGRFNDLGIGHLSSAVSSPSSAPLTCGQGLGTQPQRATLPTNGFGPANPTVMNMTIKTLPGMEARA